MTNKANTYKSPARHKQVKMTFTDSRCLKMTQDNLNNLKRPRITETTTLTYLTKVTQNNLECLRMTQNDLE